MRELVRPGGFGEVLHQRLLRHAAQCNAAGKSWLEDWWLEAAYLAFREPNVRHNHN